MGVTVHRGVQVLIAMVSLIMEHEEALGVWASVIASCRRSSCGTQA